MKKMYIAPDCSPILLDAKDVITVSPTELTLIEKSAGDNWNW